MLATGAFSGLPPMGDPFGRPPPPPQPASGANAEPHQANNDANSSHFMGQAQPFMAPPPFAGGPSGPTPLSLRLILTRDEVHYLFGFDGVLLDQLRQQTSADLSLTDPTANEQVLTVRGSLEIIFKAFSLVCRKLWDFVSSLGGQRPLILRLAVPAGQCGSIIGKNGAKVREIRDLTGASIQVAQDSLPDSTERAVEISGPGENCLQCAYHICTIMQDSPLRGDVVPYVPRPRPFGGNAGPSPAGDWRPVFLCGDRAYVMEGNAAVPASPDILRQELAKTPLGEMAESLAALQQQQLQQHQQVPDFMDPLMLLQAISGTQAAAANNGVGANSSPHTSREMSVPEDMVGIIIGSKGAKINEIRRISGAQLHVPDEDQRRQGVERVITISGSRESVLLAQFLVQSAVDAAIRDRRSGSGFNRGGGFGRSNNSSNNHHHRQRR